MDIKYALQFENFLNSDGSLKNFLNSDSSLKIVEWASDLGTIDGQQTLGIDLGIRPSRMRHSKGTGEGLVSNGYLGADIIRLAAGDGFVPHTHPGDHLLIVIGGQGTITFGGKIYPTRAGQSYIIEGKVPHAVGAMTDHVILAVGAPHMPVDSVERMIPVGYQEVATELNELHCLLCDKIATYPRHLHDLECSHCPCIDCNPMA